MIAPERMRHAMAGFATGLSVVAAWVDGRVVGMPANSLVSVSLDPPIVSLSFAHTSTTWPVLRRAESWGISVLGAGQEAVLRDLRRPTSARFEGVDLESQGTAVFLRDALATIEVAPRTTVEAGDHTLALLDVHGLRRDESREPLVFFGSRVRTLGG